MWEAVFWICCTGNVNIFKLRPVKNMFTIDFKQIKGPCKFFQYHFKILSFLDCVM